tara:strand:- start:2030 stop:2458 length:429 start_codon:yes stop_codon:yes gene_type:complete
LQSLTPKFLPRAFLIVNGLVYGALTALFVLTPRVWFSNLGIELVDEMGYTELQTMYIGMMGSMAVFSLMALIFASLLEPALILFLVNYAALAAVRSWGIYVEGLFDDLTLRLLYAELLSALLALVSLLSHRRAKQTSLGTVT